MSVNLAAIPALRSARWRGLLQRLVSYGLFGALLLYGWRNWSLVDSLPGYSDTLEVAWLLR